MTDIIESTEIDYIHFSIRSPIDIIKNAVVEVKSEDTYSQGNPVDNGLFDLRMGSLEYGDICATCNLNSKFCTGHPGFFRLATPIIHPLFYDIVKKLLESVCFRCSRILIIETEIPRILKLKSIRRLDEIKKKASTTCFYCKQTQPVIKKVSTQFTYQFKDEDSKKEDLMPSLILIILKRITPDDAKVLGFFDNNRPEYMILTVLPILEPVARPTVITDNNQRGEDDITVIYTNIIRQNRTIDLKIKNNKDNSDKNAGILVKYIDMLSCYIYQLISGGALKAGFNSMTSARTNRPLRSLSDRMNTKYGRFRRNLMGKRVNHSARTVITPDPTYNIHTLGMPLEIASILTFPEIVNDFNKKRLYTYITNAYIDKYPRAFKLVRGTQIRIIDLIKEDIILKTGDKVIRQLIDGDVVLFNRQPTLLKMSMMAFKVKVISGKTFRINLSVTTPFNADFDGDEMNAHIPQSDSTAFEIWNLARPETQLITPQTNGPIMGIVQDSLVGSYLMTLESTKISKSVMNNILANNPYYNCEKMAKNNGKDIISTILPAINLHRFSNTYTDNENKTVDSKSEKGHNYLIDSRIEVRNGKVISGTIDKSVLGAKKQNGFVHTIVNDFGIEEAGFFLWMIQQYTNKFLMSRGMTIGVGDIYPSEDLSKKMDHKISEGIVKIYELIDRIDANLYVPPIGLNIEEGFEHMATEILNGITLNVANEAIDLLDPVTNNLLIMGSTGSGSKGEALNIGQIMGCVGQQNVNRKRIAQNYGQQRSMPYFQRFDFNPKARGFVEHSFLKGLDVVEFFHHMIGGREGIIDTAIKTADSGYISRRIMKSMEDIMIKYDGTVRNASDRIIQYQYGEDNIDPVKIELQRIETIMLDNEKFDKKYKWETKELKGIKYNKDALDKEYESILNDKIHIIRLIIDSNTEMTDKFYLPLNINRMIINMKNRGSRLYSPEPTGLAVMPIINDTSYIIEACNELVKSLNCTNIFKILIRHILSSKRVIKEYELDKLSFDQLINNIKMKYFDAIIEPGTMVGAIASQSLGEPSTQLTLNTFHYSGVNSKSNVTAGVPRLRELLDISNNLKNPKLSISLKNPIDKEHANKVKNELINIKLIDLADEMSIIFDPDLNHSIIERDQRVINDFKKYFIGVSIPPVLSNLVIRIKLNRTKILYNQITMTEIRRKISEEVDYFVITSNENAPELILRVYLTGNKDKMTYENMIIHKNKLIHKFILRGISNLASVQVREEKNKKYFDNETNTIKQRNEFVLDTDGSNLIDVLKHPDIDIKYTWTTNIHEINHIFGIDAARRVLLNEIRDVFTFNGIYINYHHIALLVDNMTYTGTLTSVNRHGFNKIDDISPLSKSSFEQTALKFKLAALNRATDNMDSVSARVMFGHPIKGGTNAFTINIDEDVFGVGIEDLV